jgi:uncharacterized protein
VTDMDPTIEAVAAAFVAAIEEGDIDAIADHIYAPDVVVWHNIDGVEKSSEQSCAMLRWLSATVRPIKYDDIVRQPIPGGFVERHTLRGSTPAGDTVEVPTCYVATVADGRITRLDEYFDSRAIAALAAYQVPF